MSNVENFPTPEESAITPPAEAVQKAPPPQAILGLLKAQLQGATNLITGDLKMIDPKVSPTTYQTYRWLGGAFAECYRKLVEAAKSASIVPDDVPVPTFFLLDIPEVLANAEGRFLTAFEACDLDNMPPGEPKEAEFERLLKIKWAINKAVHAAMQNFAALADALNSPTYKLAATEEERVAAWRAARRKKFEETLTAIDANEAELKKGLEQLAASKATILKHLEDNDQLTFNDIDPDKPVILGEDETVPDESAAP